ncbi:MAG: hypothetical protein HY047_18845 [Acidobacteria bacterium]|nr:hypothetical protein [Acidobacteriota bacterium]
MLPTTDLERILDRIHAWTRSVDQRIGVLVGLESAVLGFALIRILDWYHRLTERPWFQGAILIGLGLLTASIVEALRALFPRTGNVSRCRSLTFFGDIAGESLDSYRQKVDSANDESYRRDFVDQIHTSSVIAARKFHSFKLSVLLFASGLATVACAYCIYELAG